MLELFFTFFQVGNMDSLNRFLQKKSWVTTLFLLIIITVMGSFLRIRYLAGSDFPLNDGGMFYSMILDLQANHYQLPAFTSYNLSNIPYAYPPLSFYTVGFLNQYLSINLLALFRFYPLFFNILSIPLFYFLARELSHQNKFRSIIATAFYAILLSSYEWLIIGGGLTRSPAQTFFICALTFYLVYLRTSQRKFFVISVSFAALMTSHHLEYAWMLAFSIVLFSYQKNRVIQNSIRVIIYFFLLVLLISPYWLTILGYHGLSPFISAFSSGDFNLFASISRLITLVFTEEFLSNYINILAILGIFFTLFTRQNLKISFWLFLITILDNRSAFRSLVFPVVILAAVGLDYILEALKSSYTSSRSAISEKALAREVSALTILFIGFSILYPFFLGLLNTSSEQLVLSSITNSEIQSMEWVKENTSKDSQFIVINSSESWIVDRIGEWFPALAQRKSLTTVQGNEWFPKQEYQSVKQLSNQLRQCIKSGLPCPDFWKNSNTSTPKYIYIARSECNPNVNGCQQRLKSLFGDSIEYQMVYENDSVEIFLIDYKLPG